MLNDVQAKEEDDKEEEDKDKDEDMNMNSTNEMLEQDNNQEINVMQKYKQRYQHRNNLKNYNK